MTDPLLDVTGLSVHAITKSGTSTLVNDVDFDLHAGEVLGVVGESGSGKSMLMKAVLALLPPRVECVGQVRFDGERVDQLDERTFRQLRGRRLSLLFQDPFTMLNPVQTVRATIAETLRPESRRSRSEANEEVARRLAEVGLPAEVAAKRPFQLSGGMRQRVAIAAALAADPEVLIADEPTTALDVSTQDEVLRLLGMLREQRGLALILITHDLRVAFDVCDRVMVMYAGSVMEQATASELRVSTLHPYTSGLMAAEPAVDRWTENLNVLPGSVPAADSVRGQCAFAARCAWVEKECTTQTPALDTIGVQHASRCRRVNEIRVELARQNDVTTHPAARPRSAEPEGPALLAVDGLTKTYHTHSLVGGKASHTALHGVSLIVGAGEAVGLVGESGSGKTTIARSILGLTRPDGGRIELDGFDITDYRRLSRADSRAVRRLVQPVFQDPYASLNPQLTIGQTLEEAVRARDDTSNAPQQVASALERVQLPASYAKRLPRGLSGGERQRISIARAVCLTPQLLICDEPVAALDVSVQAQVLELLRTLREELGMAMLFITHDLAVIRQMTERVVVLEHGVIVESGATDVVLDQPNHRYTRQLIDAIPGHRVSAPIVDQDSPTLGLEGTHHDRNAN
jgi:peptide/nickel transport system ATP-binding protein